MMRSDRVTCKSSSSSASKSRKSDHLSAQHDSDTAPIDTDRYGDSLARGKSTLASRMAANEKRGIRIVVPVPLHDESSSVEVSSARGRRSSARLRTSSARAGDHVDADADTSAQFASAAAAMQAAAAIQAPSSGTSSASECGASDARDLAAAPGPSSLVGEYVDLLRRYPAYRQLWLGGLVSSLGSWFSLLANMALIQSLSSSNLHVSLLFVSLLLAGALVSPLAGILVDKYPRGPLLLLADGVRAVAVLGFLLISRPSQLWLMYVLVLFTALWDAVFRPCKDALIPDLFSASADLELANSLNSVTNSATMAFGSALGGAVTSFTGTSLAFCFDSLSFVLSGVCVWRMMRLHAAAAWRMPGAAGSAVAAAAEHDDDDDVTPLLDASDGARTGEGASELHDGSSWTWLFTHGNGFALAWLSLLQALLKAADAAADMTMTGLSKSDFRLGASNGARGLGAIFGCAGVGVFVGASLYRRMNRARRDWREHFTTLGFLVSLGGYLLLAWSANALAFLASGFVIGIGLVLIYNSGTTITQLKAPSAMRGRVLAAAQGLRLGLGAAGFLLSSYALDGLHWTPRTLALLITVPLVALGFVLSWMLFRTRMGLALVADEPA